ncbi:MAG TPA: hypothetical protein GXZ48_05850 [Acholeplasmataceae bacterium]|nr:hypothetical protein [Acholeplasmataceae bacterium]
MESIYEKIEKKCALEAQEIIDEGKARADEIKSTLINEAKKEAEIIINKANAKSAEKIQTERTSFEQIAKQKSLQNKKNLIDKAINLSLEKLNNLDDDKLYKFVINKLSLEKLNGDEIIKVSQNDYSRYSKVFSTGKKENNFIVLDKLNQALGLNLKLANDFANIDGGFVVIGKNFDLDYSFSAILFRIKDEYEVEIARILFKGD